VDVIIKEYLRPGDQWGDGSCPYMVKIPPKEEKKGSCLPRGFDRSSPLKFRVKCIIIGWVGCINLRKALRREISYNIV
jgi:hypothetical protein